MEQKENIDNLLANREIKMEIAQLSSLENKRSGNKSAGMTHPDQTVYGVQLGFGGGVRAVLGTCLRRMISRKFVRRANFLFFLSLFLLGVVAVRVFSLQVLQGKFYREEALSRLVLEETLPSRGSILDRSGKVLAEDVGVLSISAYPPQMDDPEKIAEELSQLLSLSASELQQKFQSGLFWIEITDNAPLYLKEALEEKKLKGISWKEKPVRFYPQAPLFSNLLGFVGKDRQGLEGLEFAFDSYIAGKPGYTFLRKRCSGARNTSYY